MGATEEAGKVATGVVEGLKNQPLMLALVIVNLIFLIVVYFGQENTREHYEKIINALIDNQAKATELLSRCGPVTKSELPLPLPYKLDLIK